MSEDELSIGAGASDDEFVQEADKASPKSSPEIPKRSKPRREDLSSGEVTPEEGDSDDSFSWRENRVRSMLQSHVQKPNSDVTHRESYDRYDSDHEGDQQFRSVVGTTITRPGQRYSDSGEITDSEDEKEQERRKSSRRSSSPKRRTNGDEKRSRTQKSSSVRHGDDRESMDKSRDYSRSEHESGRDRKRTRKRSKDGSKERTEDHRKEKRSKENKNGDQYEDARVKFRKRVWDRKEEESKDKKRTHEPSSPEKEKQKEEDATNKENEQPPPPKKKKEESLITRTGGAYIPPAKLRMMQEQITDKSSEAYQRMSWEALKKSINGLINKVNVPNIAMIVSELLQLNIVRGRGLMARSIITAQTASPTFTHVYAALVAVINTKFPQNGELLLRRLIINFKKGYRRNDKTLCLSSTRFIAHLVNQQVAHEILALEILTLLLETVTDDSVEVAVGFVKECGLKLQEVSPRGIHAIFERMRNILHEAQIDKRVQYMVEVVFANRKDGFKDYPAIVPELDLVEETDQFTHMLTLEDNYQDENLLNVFKNDPDYLENEEKYKAIKKEILDEDSDDSDSDGESGEATSSQESDEEKEEAEKMEIIDQTETNLVALRRTIYLTIQSSLDFEECAHKMLKMEFKPGQEREVCMMILDCCAQQRTYEKFFGLLAQRFCQLKREYVAVFESIFPEQYSTCHRLDTNKLRNVAKMFAHLLFTDAISWTVIASIRMNEEDTTSSSRIFVKILFLELSEFMGLPKLNDRLKDKTLMPYFEGLLPRDNPANTRFAINFFTTIGLGGLTDDLRDHLKNVQRQIMQQRQPVLPSDSSSESSSESESESSSSSSSSSESSSDSSSGSSSDSDRDKSKKKKKKKKGKEVKGKPGKENNRGKKAERTRDEEKPKRRDKSVAVQSSNGKDRRERVRELEDNRTRRNEHARESEENRTRRNEHARDFEENRTRRNEHPREFEENRTRRNEHAREFEENRTRRNEHTREFEENRTRRNEHARDFEENRTRRNEHVRDFEENRTRRNEHARELEEHGTKRNERVGDRPDGRGKQNDSRANRTTNNERDQRVTRKDDGNRSKIRASDDHSEERATRRKEQQATNSKCQQLEEESESSESGSSSSEESSSSSSESESSIDASPQQDKQGRLNESREMGRGRDDRDMYVRETFSDKENQRGNRQRTRTNSEGYQSYNDSGRDYVRHNDKPNNEYVDHRQGRGDGWDPRRKRDDQYERGNVRNPRTRYNSRGEDDFVHNARNKDYNRQRMEVDGYDRRNDRGRGGGRGRYNDRGGRYDGDKGSRYNRY
ncbi:uncharacterized protein [Amphiura filiformis]